MACKGKFPVRTKIIVNQDHIEQISHFCFLGCHKSHAQEKDITHKISKKKDDIWHNSKDTPT